MSIHSIPRVRRKRKNWRNYLSQQRRIDSYNVSIEVVRVEARMKAQLRLSPQAWDEIEARWQTSNAYMPEQRLNFLLHEEMVLEEARLEHSAEEALQ